MKSFLILIPLLLASCGSLSLQRDTSGNPVLVNEETGATTPLPDEATIGNTAGTIAGAAFGNPVIGMALAGAITAALSGLLGKKPLP